MKQARTDPDRGTADLSRWSHQRALGAAAFVILFILGYAAVNFRSIVEPGLEKSDYAVYALQVDRAQHLQEYLGPYSRFGFNHPGPISWYYLALMEIPLNSIPSPYGRHQLAQLILNAFFMVLSVYLLARLVPDPKVVFALFPLFLICLLPYGKNVFFDLWPPTFLIFPVLCFTLSCANLALGRLEFLWITVASSAFMIENNISTLVVFVPMSTMTISLYLISRRSAVDQVSHRPGVRKLSVYLSILFALIVAAPPIYEQLTSEDGNLTKITKFFEENRDLGHNLPDAFAYVSEYARTPISHLSIINGPLFFVILLGCSVWTYASATRPARFLVLYVWVAFAMSILGATRITGPLLTYILRYDVAFVCLLYLIVLMPLLLRIPATQYPRASRFFGTLLFVGGLLWAFLLYGISYQTPDDKIQGIVQAMKPAIGKEYEITLAAGHHDRWEIAAGLLLQLHRMGFRVCVPESLQLFEKPMYCKTESLRERVVLYNSKSHQAPIRNGMFVTGMTTVEFGDLKPLDVPVVIYFSHQNDYFLGWKNAGKSVRLPIEDVGTIALPLGNVDVHTQYLVSIKGRALNSRQLRVSVNGVILQHVEHANDPRKEWRFLCPGELLGEKTNMFYLEDLQSFNSLTLEKQIVSK